MGRASSPSASQGKNIKFKNCGAHQHQTDCKPEASVQFMAAIQGKHVWLTAFRDVIGALPSASPKITMKTDSDAIEDLPLDVKNITFNYNTNRNVIRSITSVSL